MDPRPCEPFLQEKNPAELPAEQAEQRGRNREEAVVKMNGNGREGDVKKKNEKKILRVKAT